MAPGAMVPGFVGLAAEGPGLTTAGLAGPGFTAFGPAVAGFGAAKGAGLGTQPLPQLPPNNRPD